MSTLAEIVDKIKIALGSGVSTDEGVLDDAFIANKVHGARAMIISTAARTPARDRIVEACVQTINPGLLEYDVECDAVRFKCPTVISIDDRHDGFVYVGHVNQMKPFMRIRSNYTALSMHSLFAKEKEVLWDYTAGYQGEFTINVYKNSKLTNLLVKAIFNDPTQVPNYREDIDQYPIDATLEVELVEMVVNDLMRKFVRVPDTISDSTETFQTGK